MRFFRIFLVCLLLLLCETALAASKGTLLYVPMDNRPVNLDYTVESLQAAGWEVKTPPREYIARNNYKGDPEAMFQWLTQEAPTSTAMVVSADALIYGGLTSSRTHDLSWDVLQGRVARLLSLKKNFHGQDVYVFATIMRSPKASSAPEEPAYYAQWGPKLFRRGALEDKLEQKQIKNKELRELRALQQEIPANILSDLDGRREKNFRATGLLLNGVEQGAFDYLLIGKDDSAVYSQAHREARKLNALVTKLPKERIRFFSGADELGILLLSRAATRLNYDLPLVKVVYAPGQAGQTIPSYEDDIIAKSIKEHIYASGSFPAQNLQYADLVLAMNTPQNGVTYESSNAVNNYTLTPEIRAFTNTVKQLLGKHRVVVADVKYGNGADNALVKNLFTEKIAYDLSAYGGWNTASNSLGFALAQGLLSSQYSKAVKQHLLNVRYLDDWAYQANARLAVYQTLIWPQSWPNGGLKDAKLATTQAAVTQAIQKTAIPLMGDAVQNYRFTLPWQRMFEVKVEKVK